MQVKTKTTYFFLEKPQLLTNFLKKKMDSLKALGNSRTIYDREFSNKNLPNLRKLDHKFCLKLEVGNVYHDFYTFAVHGICIQGNELNFR